MSERPQPEREGDVVPTGAEFAGWASRGFLARRLAVGPLALRLERLDADCAESLDRWAGDASAAPAGGRAEDLRLEVLRSERPAYLTRRPGDRLRLLTWREGTGFAAVTHHGAVLMDEDLAQGLLLLGPQDDGERDRTLQNLLRVVTSWALARSGRGLLLHASAVVHEGRAVVFIGPSGAGKSTAVRLSAPRAALGDDVVVLTSTAQGWLAHSSPFFAEPAMVQRHAGPAAVPVAALLALVHAPRTELRPLGRARAASLVAAHAPFLGGTAGALDATPAAVTLAAGIPAHSLSFARDLSFWEDLAPHLGPAAGGPAPTLDGKTLT